MTSSRVFVRVGNARILIKSVSAWFSLIMEATEETEGEEKGMARFGVDPPQVLRLLGNEGRLFSNDLLCIISLTLNLDELALKGGNEVAGRVTVAIAVLTSACISSGTYHERVSINATRGLQ
jgi:hypothetical protein